MRSRPSPCLRESSDSTLPVICQLEGPDASQNTVTRKRDPLDDLKVRPRSTHEGSLCIRLDFHQPHEDIEVLDLRRLSGRLLEGQLRVVVFPVFIIACDGKLDIIATEKSVCKPYKSELRTARTLKG